MDLLRARLRWKELKKGLTVFLLFLPTVLVCMPVILLVTGSVMGSGELRQYLAPVFTDSYRYISWKLVPDYPTFENYGKLLFMTPQFFVLFWETFMRADIIRPYTNWQASFWWVCPQHGLLPYTR